MGYCEKFRKIPDKFVLAGFGYGNEETGELKGTNYFITAPRSGIINSTKWIYLENPNV